MKQSELIDGIGRDVRGGVKSGERREDDIITLSGPLDEA